MGQSHVSFKIFHSLVDAWYLLLDRWRTMTFEQVLRPAAIEAPRWSTRAFPASPFPHTMVPGDLSVEARMPEAVRDALEARGHKLRVEGAWSQGSNAAIVIEVNTGVLGAGADPRVEAYALAR